MWDGKSRICKKCQRSDGKKRFDLYYANHKEIMIKRTINWRKKNKEKVNISSQKWKKNNIESVMISRAKNRAKEIGVEFNLTKEDILIPKNCPILGVEMKISRRKRTKRFFPIIRQN